MSTGRIKDLQARIDGLKLMGSGVYASQLIEERNFLLTNGKRPPIPKGTLNQRQKRKRARW